MRLLEIEPGVLVVPDLVTHVRGVPWGESRALGYSVFIDVLGGNSAIVHQRSWHADLPSVDHVKAEAAAAARDVADLIDRHRSGEPITVVRA